MATLLSAVSANGAGSGASHSGPCTVQIPNDSVMDGAEVHVEMSITDSAGKYGPIGREGVLTAAGQSVAVNAQGTYFLRGVVNKAGASTSITLLSNQ